LPPAPEPTRKLVELPPSPPSPPLRPRGPPVSPLAHAANPATTRVTTKIALLNLSPGAVARAEREEAPRVGRADREHRARLSEGRSPPRGFEHGRTPRAEHL